MGVYDSLARGLQTGFDLGARADEIAESKRARRFQEARQTLSDARADEELTLRRRADQRAEERQTAQEERAGVMHRLGLQQAATQALEKRRGELVGLSTAAQTAGQPVDPALGAEFGRVEQSLSQLRQQGLDDFSRLATGQMGLKDFTPERLYTSLATATNMKPEELPAVAAGAKDVEAGLQTSNQGLVVQGVNKLMAPQLRIGVGTPSPYGGTITRKEIIGLDPAIDANGREHPGRVIPRMRIYVEGVSPTGGELYYDAPLTQRRTGEPNDPVVAIDMRQGMDWMGNLGTLAEIAQHPEIAAKLAEGAKTATPVVDRYLEQLINLGKPKTAFHAVGAGGGVTTDASGKVVERVEPTAKPVTPLQQSQIAVNEARVAKLRSSGGSGGGGGGGAEPTLDEETQRTMADQYLAGDKSVMTNLGRGAQGSANVVALRQMISRVGKERGMSGRDIALAQSEFMGLGAAQRALGTRTASFGMAKEEAYGMADLVTEASSKASRTQFMPINKALNAFNTNTGDTAIREFGAAINSFINAYARAVSPTGAPTVSDKDHAREMLSTADSHQQVVAVIGQLKREMEAAGAAPGTVKENLRKGFKEPPGVGAPAAPASAPTTSRKVAPAVGTVQSGYRFKGGDPAIPASWEKVQ